MCCLENFLHTWKRFVRRKGDVAMLNKKIRTIIMLALIVVVSSFMNTTHTWAKEQIQFKAGFDWTQFKEGQDYAKGRVIVTFIDNLKEEKEMLQVIDACNFSVSAFSFKEYEGVLDAIQFL